MSEIAAAAAPEVRHSADACLTSVSPSNFAGGAPASPAPFKGKPPKAAWTREAEAALIELHAQCDGDFRKIAPKMLRSVQECRVRHRQLMMLKPRAVEVERKCLFCLRVRLIPKPNRVCDGCKQTEEFQNASAWA